MDLGRYSRGGSAAAWRRDIALHGRRARRRTTHAVAGLLAVLTRVQALGAAGRSDRARSFGKGDQRQRSRGSWIHLEGASPAMAGVRAGAVASGTRAYRFRPRDSRAAHGSGERAAQLRGASANQTGKGIW